MQTVNAEAKREFVSYKTTMEDGRKTAAADVTSSTHFDLSFSAASSVDFPLPLTFALLAVDFVSSTNNNNISA